MSVKKRPKTKSSFLMLKTHLSNWIPWESDNSRKYQIRPKMCWGWGRMESPWEKYQKLLLLSMFSDKLQRREVPNLCNKGTITFLKLLFIFSQATAELPIKLDRHEKWVYVVILLKDLPQTKKVDRTKSNPSLKKRVVKFYPFCNGESHKFVYLNDIFLSKSKLFSSHNLGLTYQSSFWAFKPVYIQKI